MSKKLLLGSTALVGAFALATPALADIEVTLSGQVEFLAQVADEETIADGRGYFFDMDNETKIEAEGAANNGINYSGKVEIELDDGGGDVDVDEARLAFWGGFGRVELGRDDGAADNMFLGGEDFQAGTGGIDGDNVNLIITGVQDTGDSVKVTYFTPRVGGLQLGVAFTPDEGDAGDDSDDDAGDIEEHVDFGANFTTSVGGADVTISGVGSIGDEEVADEGDIEDYGIGAGVEFAGFGIGGGFFFREEDRNEGNEITLGAKYGFGPANVSVGWNYLDPDGGDETNVIAFSGDYGLFPGVTIKGDLAFNTDDEDDGGDNTTAALIAVQLDY